MDEIYKEWSGKHHTENSCHPVHDSAEAMDFAQYYHNEQKMEKSNTPSDSDITLECKKYIRNLVNKPTPSEEFRIEVAFEYAAKWVRIIKDTT